MRNCQKSEKSKREGVENFNNVYLYGIRCKGKDFKYD